jgi:uncharacterized protein with von Willebrand factor type A (vWA) domain
LVDALRERGVPISVAETLDAHRAVALVGVEREPLREALAACVVKDEADRALFDQLFDAHFPLMGGVRGPAGRRHGQAGASDDGVSRPGRRRGDTTNVAGARPPLDPAGEPRRGAARDEPTETPRPAQEPDERSGRPSAERAPAREHGERSAPPRTGRQRAQQELLRKPFRDYTAVDIDAAQEVVRLLARELRARLGRRLRQRRRGRVDMRRTLRRAVSTGGVPVRLRFRGPRPGRPNLVALCDVSGSVASVTQYLLGLIAPAARFFRSVETFVFVDHLCPASFENGMVIPHAPVDFHAASDFGQVLAEYCARPVDRLDRNTVVLVLGDARNNRRPPRTRLLAGLHARARAVVWLNPEPAARWDTGDSVMTWYARHCSAATECGNLAALARALARCV